MNNVAAQPCENNSFDAASQIVDHTRNISTGSCQNHLLVTEENYYKFG